MPLLDWLTRDEDLRAADRVPYQLLDEVHELSHSDGDEGLLVQGDNLDALKALLPFYGSIWLSIDNHARHDLKVIIGEASKCPNQILNIFSHKHYYYKKRRNRGMPSRRLFAETRGKPKLSPINTTPETFENFLGSAYAHY